MRFIHLSDIHLGKCFSATRYGAGFASQRKAELLQTFARVIDFANKNLIDFILCAGDLLDEEYLSIEDLRNINTVIDQLQRGKMIVISGNHDPQTPQSIYRKIPWTSKLCLCPPGFGSVSLMKPNVMVHYHSWDTKEIREHLLDEANFELAGQYNILMLHGDCTSNKKESVYFPIDLDQLKKLGFHYIALGHIHKSAQLADNIWYSGSLEPLNFGETGQHGFLICEVEGERTRSRFVPFASREYATLQIEVSPEESESTICDRIGSEIIRENPQNIYQITLVGRHNALAGLNIPAMEDSLREKDFCCALEDKSIPDYDISALYRENRSNIIGDFISSFGAPEQLSTLERKALDYGLRALLSQKEGESWRM